MRAVSLGGGVQSTVMLMMGAAGVFGEPPDVAIFADTGNEPPEVYEMVEWLGRNQPVEVVTVRAGRPITEAFAAGVDPRGHPLGAVVPTHTVDERGGKGMSRRFCTRNWKLLPIERELRRRLGVARVTAASGLRAESWIGISTDEVERVKPNPTSWIDNRWPLIEADMKRSDCVSWWDEKAPAGAPPLARSACVICPYRTRAEWVELYNRHPELVEEAAEVERQHQITDDERGAGKPLRHFLHITRRPLIEAVKRDAANDAAQQTLFDRAGECSGYCWT